MFCFYFCFDFILSCVVLYVTIMLLSGCRTEPKKARCGSRAPGSQIRLHLHIPLRRVHHSSGAEAALFSRICRRIPRQKAGQAVMSSLPLAELSGKACFIFQQDSLLCVNGRINKDLKIFFL